MTAQEYLDSLPMFQWLSFSQVPGELQEEVFLLLELNQFNCYRVGFNEIHSNLFMKTKMAEKKHILETLKTLERDIGQVEWVYIDTGESGYLVVISTEGLVKSTDNMVINKLFPPKTHIFEHYEWIYKYAKMVKLKYRDEKQEETRNTE